MKLSISQENYIETIYILEQEDKSANVSMLAERIGVKKPTVTASLKLLVEKQLVNHVRYGKITLTEKGRELAIEIYRKHCLLRDFFIDFLKISPDVAESNACLIEHSIDSEVINALHDYVEFINSKKACQDCLQLFENISNEKNTTKKGYNI